MMVCTPPFGQYVSELLITRGLKDALPMVTESQKEIIETSRSFFRWAKMYYSKAFLSLPPYWVNDLIPPKVIDRAGGHIFESLEEAFQLSNLCKERDDLALWRDQSAAAFLFLSGMRARAFITLPMAAVNFDRLEVYQWPKEYGGRDEGQANGYDNLATDPRVGGSRQRPG